MIILCFCVFCVVCGRAQGCALPEDEIDKRILGLVVVVRTVDPVYVQRPILWFS